MDFMSQDKLHSVKKYISFCIFLIIFVEIKNVIYHFTKNYDNVSDIQVKTDDLNEYYQKLMNQQQGNINKKNTGNEKIDHKEIKIQKEGYLFDINKIEVKELISLGIDEKVSQRIIKYRNLLGGYISVNQLSEVYGFNKYDKLKNRFFIKKDFKPTKINLNKATIKELLRHPYISYEESKKIYRFYNNSQKKSSNDLSYLSQIFDEKIYNKIIHYLSIEE